MEKIPSRTGSANSEPPYWPPDLKDYPKDLVADVTTVSTASISLITKITQKVRQEAGGIGFLVSCKRCTDPLSLGQLDCDGIVDRHSEAAVDQALLGASDVLEQLTHDPLANEADWSKMRSIDFVELLHERDDILRRRKRINVATNSPEFVDQVSCAS